MHSTLVIYLSWNSWVVSKAKDLLIPTHLFQEMSIKWLVILLELFTLLHKCGNLDYVRYDAMKEDLESIVANPHVIPILRIISFEESLFYEM